MYAVHLIKKKEIIGLIVLIKLKLVVDLFIYKTIIFKCYKTL